MNHYHYKTETDNFFTVFSSKNHVDNRFALFNKSIKKMTIYELTEPFRKRSDFTRQLNYSFTYAMGLPIFWASFTARTLLNTPGLIIKSIFFPKTCKENAIKLSTNLGASFFLAIYAAIKPVICFLGLLTRAIITCLKPKRPDAIRPRFDYFNEDTLSSSSSSSTSSDDDPSPRTNC